MGKTIRMRAATKPKFKYSINHQIGLLPHKRDLIQQIIDHLAKHGITRTEFYADRRILLDSKKSIPSDRLMIYAQVFECKTEDLVNHQVNAKSIREVMAKSKVRVRSSLR